MIIDPETGAIIAKGDKFNSRHLWTRTDINHWECQKCDCHKEQFGEKQFQYWCNKEKFDKAPLCTNSKLIIEKQKKDEKQTDAIQLKFW